VPVRRTGTRSLTQSSIGPNRCYGSENGSLYPALHRLEDRGWISSFWGTSENNRKAKYYRLTPAGRKQLAEQTGRWEQLTGAIKRVLSPATE